MSCNPSSRKRLLAPRLRLAAWYLMIVAAMAGCSSEDGGPATEHVAGTVTYRGKPAAGAILMFHAGAKGIDAQTITDDAGNFVVSTYFDMGKREKQGMVAGDYRVTAMKLDMKSIKSTKRPPKNLLPRRYASPKTSALAATVSAGEENILHFELK